MLSMIFYPFFGLRSLVVFFMVWGAMEFSLRLLFKKEIPCPHCGFDASWYKKDVKVARQKVKEFWDQKKIKEIQRDEIIKLRTFLNQFY